jgi:hypothetical protein
VPIVLGTNVVVLFGIVPDALNNTMQAAAVTMLSRPAIVPEFETKNLRQQVILPGPKAMTLQEAAAYTEMMKRGPQGKGGGGAATKKGGPAPGKKGAAKAKTGDGGASGKNAPEKAKSGAGASRARRGGSRLEAVAMKVGARP